MIRRMIMRERRRSLSLLLILIGVGGILLAIAVDLIGAGGRSGFGLKQLLLATAGGVAVAAGLLGLSPIGRRFARRVDPSASTVAPSPLLIAGWIGLLTALTEIGLLSYRRYVAGRMIFVGPHYFWTILVVDILTALLIAGSLIAGARLLRREIAPSTIVTATSLLGFLLILEYFEQVHLVARLLLAAGLAVQLGRLHAARPRILGGLVESVLGWSTLLRSTDDDKLPALTRRDLLISTGATVILVGTGGATASRLITGGTRARAAARPGRPNVLFIVLDTARARSFSLYGRARRTSPMLDRLAEESIVYRAAIAPAPWTLPSHASMFTGRAPGELSTSYANPLDGRFPTLAERLGEAGYQCAGFVANLIYCAREFGLARGFDHYEDYPLTAGQMLLDSALGRAYQDASRLRQVLGQHELLNRIGAAEITDSFLAWHRQRGDRPYFAFLNYYDPHAPYLPPDDFAFRFADARPSRQLQTGAGYTADEVASLLAAYEAAIAYTDYELGRLLRSLAESGELEQTLVVIVGDHGEEFAEHGVMGHGHSLYLPTVRVPLVVRLPGGRLGGTTVDTIVSTTDLATTVLEVVDGGGAELPGTSLIPDGTRNGAPALAPRSVTTEVEQWQGPGNYPSAVGDMRAIFYQRMNYIVNLGSGQEELYDLREDWEQQVDLVRSASARVPLRELRDRLEAAFDRHAVLPPSSRASG